MITTTSPKMNASPTAWRSGCISNHDRAVGEPIMATHQTTPTATCASRYPIHTRSPAARVRSSCTVATRRRLRGFGFGLQERVDDDRHDGLGAGAAGAVDRLDAPPRDLRDRAPGDAGV